MGKGNIGNELIAEFMELRKVPCNIGTEYGDVTEGYMHSSCNMPMDVDSLQFRYKWNWLMPVVDKIFHDTDAVNESTNRIGDITHALVDVNIEDTYKAVVEFIKWYNENR